MTVDLENNLTPGETVVYRSGFSRRQMLLRLFLVPPLLLVASFLIAIAVTSVLGSGGVWAIYVGVGGTGGYVLKMIYWGSNEVILTESRLLYRSRTRGDITHDIQMNEIKRFDGPAQMIVKVNLHDGRVIDLAGILHAERLWKVLPESLKNPEARKSQRKFLIFLNIAILLGVFTGFAAFFILSFSVLYPVSKLPIHDVTASVIIVLFVLIPGFIVGSFVSIFAMPIIGLTIFHDYLDLEEAKRFATFNRDFSSRTDIGRISRAYLRMCERHLGRLYKRPVKLFPDQSGA